jgi:predicted porin
VKYAVQYGNESGNNAETDKFKGYRVAARYETNPGFSIEAMAAQFERGMEADRTTAQVFAGYRAKRGRVGAQYSFQKRRAAAGSTSPDLDLNIISGFGVFDLTPQKVSAFLRVDRVADPCADCSGIDYLPIDTKEAFTMTLAGIEYLIHPAVRFSPNVEWVAYGSPSGAAARPKDDLAARLTFYWVW